MMSSVPILAGPDNVDNPYASITPTDMLAGLRKQRLYATPGDKWEYSNLGMGLLGFALTARTGRNYEAMLRFLHFAMDPPPTSAGAAMRLTQEPRFIADSTVTMGLGWLLLKRPQFGEPVHFHNGGTGGYCSFLAFHRQSGVGVVILCNTDNDDLDGIGFSLLSALRDARGGAEIRPEKPRS